MLALQDYAMILMAEARTSVDEVLENLVVGTWISSTNRKARMKIEN